MTMVDSIISVLKWICYVAAYLLIQLLPLAAAGTGWLVANGAKSGGPCAVIVAVILYLCTSLAFAALLTKLTER